MSQDLHILPKLRDSLSYLYVEQAVVQRQQHAIEVLDENGRILVPVASLSLLMLGPGTSITHPAVQVLAANGCSIMWVGQDGTRFYAWGTGETHKGYRLLRQAALVSDPEARQEIILRMYRKRFDQDLDPALTLPQIRGLEGVRVREAYAEASRTYNVPWQGRQYDRTNWHNADPINRALSAANALLNGICHVTIVSGGYSPTLGFVHTGRYLSFVYDIADLYKTEITIPVAFEVVSQSPEGVEARVRQACRERFRQVGLLGRILPDIDSLLGLKATEELSDDTLDDEAFLLQGLWPSLVEEPTE
jgi:CRISPR-associated protein Cas1